MTAGQVCGKQHHPEPQQEHLAALGALADASVQTTTSSAAPHNYNFSAAIAAKQN